MRKDPHSLNGSLNITNSGANFDYISLLSPCKDKILKTNPISAHSKLVNTVYSQKNKRIYRNSRPISARFISNSENISNGKKMKLYNSYESKKYSNNLSRRSVIINNQIKIKQNYRVINFQKTAHQKINKEINFM